MNEFISISSNSCITGIGWTCKTIRTSIIPRVITSFAAVSHVLPPVLSSLHTSFVCSQSISTLTNLIQKSMHFHNVRSKKEQKEYKEFEQLFSVPVHCNHSDSHVIENIQNNRWLCISATHMSEAIFTSQLKNKEKIDRRCWQQRASHSKISNACLAKINEQNLTRLSHSKISNAYDCGMGRVCHQFGHWHGTSC